MQRSFGIVTVVLGLVACAGCATTTERSETPPLDGTAWVLSSLPGRALIAGRPATASFEAGRVMGSDGCNRYTTTYLIRDSALEIASPLASTRMACPPDAMRQAQHFSEALANTRRYRVRDGRLELLSADGVLLASLASQSRALVGDPWHATGINDGRGGLVSPIADSVVTIVFAENGEVSGSAGCNAYTARSLLDGSRIHFTPAAATRKLCDAALMEQERAFFEAMKSVATMRVDDDRLELRTAEGAIALSLVRPVATEPSR